MRLAHSAAGATAPLLCDGRGPQLRFRARVNRSVVGLLAPRLAPPRIAPSSALNLSPCSASRPQIVEVLGVFRRWSSSSTTAAHESCDPTARGCCCIALHMLKTNVSCDAATPCCHARRDAWFTLGGLDLIIFK